VRIKLRRLPNRWDARWDTFIPTHGRSYRFGEIRRDESNGLCRWVPARQLFDNRLPICFGFYL